MVPGVRAGQHARSGRLGQLSERTILIVEDDAGIRMMLELALAERGYSVQSAATVVDAAAAAARLSPALVLLDVRLDGADGLSLAQPLRSKGAAVVIMTASENAEAAAARVGADGFLAKPFDLDEAYALADRYAGSGG